MRFHIGQPVYIKWTPNISGPACRYLCSVGEIVGGPYRPRQVVNGIPAVDSRSWMVDAGFHRETAIIAEYLLEPFEPPAREVDFEQCLELTE